MPLVRLMRVRLVLACAMVAGAAACGPAPEEAEAPSPVTAQPCEPPPEGSTPDPNATLAGLTGQWRLTVVADQGEGAPARQDVVLTLRAHDLGMQVVQGMDGPPRPDASAPLYGFTDLDVEALGGLPTRGLDSEDPAAPGVGVYETRQAGDIAPPSIILRLGPEANRRESQGAMDGGTTALQVRVIEDSRFAGTWRSRANGQARASGYFCATLPLDGFGD